MAAIPSRTPSQRRLGATSRRLGFVFAAIAAIAIVVTVVVAVAQPNDKSPPFKCVPAEGVTSGHRSSRNSCFAGTRTTGVGVTKPRAKPGASSP